MYNYLSSRTLSFLIDKFIGSCIRSLRRGEAIFNKISFMIIIIFNVFIMLLKERIDWEEVFWKYIHFLIAVDGCIDKESVTEKLLCYFIAAVVLVIL